MARIIILKNGKRKIDAGTEWDYERFKAIHGYYSIINLMLKLLENEHKLFRKIRKEENFILNEEEKGILAKKLEEYIEKDIRNFKEAQDNDIYISIPYKNRMYKAPVKQNNSTLEKKLTKAISLYNQFNDPENSNIVEFRFNEGK
ncbi:MULTISPECIES: hypothetical protein [unclassified Chryseobacterium]|uniref:hypothetical protein n=1 Tax=unclassified Chryseobacterium TaxID=2593645 RepID=UPI000D7540F6|nr:MULTISPECIES: hypothetical protein [unclassified Chryseobacterium]PXW07784.1 hypothetical protein C8D70_12014 [Chryseobacterium sp. CBTAP 102]